MNKKFIYLLCLFILQFSIIVFIFRYTSSNVYISEALSIERYKYNEITIGIIILTKNRPKSLERLIVSIQNSYCPKDIDIEFHIDGFDADTVSTIYKYFDYPIIKISEKSLGLRAAWLNAYRNTDKHVVILEDDVELSAFWYMYLERAWKKYDFAEDLAGITLSRQTLVPASRSKQKTIINSYKPFLYKLVGSIGFSPNPYVWIQFLDWVDTIEDLDTFAANVPGLITSEWYKVLDKRSMWTQLFIYYCNENELYTLYTTFRNKKTLAAHWREPGEHFKKVASREFELVDHESYIDTLDFATYPRKYDWNADQIKRKVFVSVHTESRARNNNYKTFECLSKDYDMFILDKEPTGSVYLPWTKKYYNVDSSLSHFRKIVALAAVWEKYDVFIYVDSDVIIGNATYDIDVFEEDIIFNKNPIHGVNAGAFIIKKSAYAEEFLTEWWSMRDSKQPHSDQGALYSVLLRRFKSKTSYAYNDECTRIRNFWGAATGCFNNAMEKLGYVYPDWNINNKNIRLEQSLQGFIFEGYVNRPKHKYDALDYQPYNYSYIEDVGYARGDFLLHAKQLENIASDCAIKSANFVHYKDKELASFKPHAIQYTHVKRLSTIGQRWKNAHAVPDSVWSVQRDFAKINNTCYSRGCLPAVIGIGFGHSGSTSLYSTIVQHPRVIPAKRKELSYFASKEDISAEEYSENFALVDDYQMSIEFSPYYVGSKLALKQMSKLFANSSTKILLISRKNPMRACYSAYSQTERDLAWNTSRGDCVVFIRHLANHNSGPRKKFRYEPCDIKNYVDASISRWKNSVFKNRLLHIFTEDFKANPTETIARVETFIGLENYNRYRLDKTTSMHVAKRKVPRVNYYDKCFENS